MMMNPTQPTAAETSIHVGMGLVRVAPPLMAQPHFQHTSASS